MAMRQAQQTFNRARWRAVIGVRQAVYVANGLSLYVGSIVNKYEVNSRKFKDYELANLVWATVLLLRWIVRSGRTARVTSAMWIFCTVAGLEIIHNDLALSRLLRSFERELKATQGALIALDAISVTLLCLFALLKSPVISSIVNLTALLIFSVLFVAAEIYQIDADQAERAAQDTNGGYRALMQQLQAIEELPYDLLLRLDAFIQRQGTPPEVVKRLPTYVKEDESKTTDGECMICFAEYEEGDEIRVLPCFHKGHTDCLEQWLRENTTCPMCQTSVDHHESDFDD